MKPTLDNFVERLERMAKAITPYARAKADRVYLELFLKSKIAILMGQSSKKTAVAREQYARSHPEYLELLNGLRAAVEVEERAKWALERFKIEVSLFQTQHADERYLKDRV